jgi:hypothetical protein
VVVCYDCPLNVALGAILICDFTKWVGGGRGCDMGVPGVLKGTRCWFPRVISDVEYYWLPHLIIGISCRRRVGGVDYLPSDGLR